MFVTKNQGRRTKIYIKKNRYLKISVFHKTFKNNLLPASSFEFLLKGFVLREAIFKKRGRRRLGKKPTLTFTVQSFSRGVTGGNAGFKGQAGRK